MSTGSNVVNHESSSLLCTCLTADCSEGIVLVTIRNKLTNSTGPGCVTVKKGCDKNLNVRSKQPNKSIILTLCLKRLGSLPSLRLRSMK